MTNVALDAQSTGWVDTGAGSGATSLNSTNLTVVSPTALLLGTVVFPTNVSAVAMTWNAVAMSLLASIAASDASQYLYLFGLLNPATGAKTLQATWTTASDAVLEGASFSGAASPLSVAVPSANIITLSQNLPNITVDPVSALVVTTLSGDAAYASAGSTNVVMSATAAGTLLGFISGAGPYNGWDAYRLAVGSTTSIQFSNGPSTGICVHAAVRIVSATNAPAGGGGGLPTLGVGHHKRVFAMPRRCLVPPRKRLIEVRNKIITPGRTLSLMRVG